MAKLSTYPQRTLANIAGVDVSGNVGLNPNVTLSYSDSGLFFSNAGAVIQRLGDRAFVGNAVVNDGAFPNVSQDWLTQFQIAEGYTVGINVSAQFVSLTDTHPNSSLAGSFGSQSLYSNSSGTATIGVNSIIVNNNATLSTNAYAYYGEANLTSSAVNSVIGAEFDTRTLFASVIPTPYQQGNVVGLQLASGAGVSAAGQHDASCGIQFAFNPMRFQKGIVFGSASLTAANGSGGNGIAIEAARGQTIRWSNSGPGIDAEIWANAAGLYVSGNNNAGTFPNPNTGALIGANFSGGSAEVDFFNTATGATSSFSWYQQTGASAATQLMNLTTAGRLYTSGGSLTTPIAVSALPSASTAGARTFVNNSNVVASGNFGAIVAGGGANTVPVYSDGTNWRIG
jgi:hypothetical protein